MDKPDEDKRKLSLFDLCEISKEEERKKIQEEFGLLNLPPLYIAGPPRELHPMEVIDHQDPKNGNFESQWGSPISSSVLHIRKFMPRRHCGFDQVLSDSQYHGSNYSG